MFTEDLDMPMTEKEYNGILLDQLDTVERIEDALNSGEEAARKEIERQKSHINRKLYQKPPLNQE